MHSRIFQISEKPITQNELIKEYRYEDNFVGSIAEYVAEVEFKSDNYFEDLKWLQNVAKGLEVNIKKGTIKILSKKEYFDEKHDRFKELCEKLRYITLEEFIGNEFYFDICELKDTYEDKYSFYVDDNDSYFGLTNLDNWVRNAEENKEYFVGSIMDYHF